MPVLKLNEFRVPFIKGHFRELKVLRKSRATKIPGICCLLLRSPVDKSSNEPSSFGSKVFMPLRCEMVNSCFSYTSFKHAKRSFPSKS